MIFSNLPIAKIFFPASTYSLLHVFIFFLKVSCDMGVVGKTATNQVNYIDISLYHYFCHYSVGKTATNQVN